MSDLLDRFTVDELHALVDGAPDDKLPALALGVDDNLYDWDRIARRKQLPPDGDWIYWALVTGRGFGKTRTGAEWLRRRALGTVGDYAIIAPTIAKTRDVCVESGIRKNWRRRSGFLSVCDPSEIIYYNRSIYEIGLVNGSKVKLLSAEEPGDSEGWNFTAAWCDEFSSWRYPEAWFRTLLPAVRAADTHRFVITTTPKRNELTRWLLKRAEVDPERVRVVRGSTMENADNLADDFVEELRRAMTARLIRQEVEGELIDDVEGALWTLKLIDDERVPMETEVDFAEQQGSRIVVAMDPAVSSADSSDETGIIVAGRLGDHAWILEDGSGKYPALEAMERVVEAFHAFGANEVVIERNNGGDYLASLLHTVDARVPAKTVTATRGKALRADPIAGLYRRGRVHHIGTFPELEDQMTTWTPLDRKTSPDRLDALVWALTALFPELESGEGRTLRFRGAA